ATRIITSVATNRPAWGQAGGAMAHVSAAKWFSVHAPTTLEIPPVRLGLWVDIGSNAVLLPGVTLGEDAMVAGEVAVRTVEPFAVVAGGPAVFPRSREGRPTARARQSFRRGARPGRPS